MKGRECPASIPLIAGGRTSALTRSARATPAQSGTPRGACAYFVPDDRRLAEPREEEIRNVLARTNKFSAEDELNCGACGYPTCRAKAAAVVNGLAEEAMCLPFLIDQAERVCNELHVPWRDLREIHRQLVSTEKLASLGQLAAGIAHELNNPLGTILLYSGLIERKLGGAAIVANDIDLVQKETQRCKRIVAGLLDFARQNRVRFSPCRLNEFAAEVIREVVQCGGTCRQEHPPQHRCGRGVDRRRYRPRPDDAGSCKSGAERHRSAGRVAAGT